MLEVERRGGAGVSRTFALELAHIMEHYGNDSADDASLVLELYLKGAQSLMLAVSFAQRAKKHSLKLWASLLEYCLAPDSKKEGAQPDGDDEGSLFGSLLEAAALSGADLASLVKQMPHGMAVEGLRPRLVAAVADYRLKLQMHENASVIALAEKKDLIRECSHRSRRGTRCDTPKKPAYPVIPKSSQEEHSGESEENDAAKVVWSKTLRPRQRCDRYSAALALPLN